MIDNPGHGLKNRTVLTECTYSSQEQNSSQSMFLEKGIIVKFPRKVSSYSSGSIQMSLWQSMIGDSSERRVGILKADFVNPENEGFCFGLLVGSK